MSNQPNSFSSPVSDEIVKNIDQLNLPVKQKHHIRLLAHCLEIFQKIAKDKSSLFEDEDLLRKWCAKQSQRFNDKKFNELFYKQMSSAAKKLNAFSLRKGKSFKELGIDDLVILVKQDNEDSL